MMLRVLFRASKSSQTHRKLCSVHMDPKAELKLYRPPAEVRGMTDLNREAFTQSITVPALRVPLKVLNKVVKSLKSVMIQRPGLTRIVPEEGSSDSRLVLLDPQKVTSASSFSGPEEEALRAFSVAQELQDYELTLGYENLKSEEVLEAVLPPGQDVTSGFSRVGHIAHMNLRDHQLPYRNLIGQVIIDKNPGVTCVVNKTNSIDSTYRNFKMEVMAGEENMVAKVKENGAAYEFDFSRVYWNPRLSTEHQRIVQQVARGDTVFDVFAGVGPFAVPAARCGATVYANDLNPESFRWLKHNCKLNKVETRVRTFNMDGRAFIRGAVRDELPALLKHKATVHVVMNLPALAIDFLDAFQGLLQDEPPPDAPLPTVHCYGFSKEEDAARDVTQRASDAVGVSLENRSTVHFVRNVAPNKDMLCVSFRVPREVLYSSEYTAAGEGHDTPARSTRDQSEPGLFLSESADQPASKRQKCEDPAQTT